MKSFIRAISILILWPTIGLGPYLIHNPYDVEITVGKAVALSIGGPISAMVWATTSMGKASTKIPWDKCIHNCKEVGK